MEKFNPTPTEAVSKNPGETNESIDKPDFVKKIEGFDINNITPENIEFMNRVIQNVFRDNFPVDDEIIDKIPECMKLVDREEFIRLRNDANEDSDANLGFYSKKLDKMLINVTDHETPGVLFATMFHESLHFAGIQAGAGLAGGFDYPDIGESEEANELMSELDKGFNTMVEGTTQTLTKAYVMGYLGFDSHPQMYSYDPECLVMEAIWEPFSRDEKLKAYFNTPLDLLRVRVENTFEEDYDVDKPTGLFANCLVGIARATTRMERALDSWNEKDDSTPVEEVLKDVCRATGYFIVRDVENGDRKLSEEDKEYLHDYLDSYITEE